MSGLKILFDEQGLTPDTDGEPGRPSTSFERTSSPLSQNLPRVYGGDSSGAPSQGAIVGSMLAAKNKLTKRRRLSPSNLLLLLAAAAVIIVLYISNIIAISQLMSEVNQLQQRQRQVLNDQELLRAQLNRMSSLERIRRLAENDLGLQNPADIPVWIKVDQDRAAGLQQAEQAGHLPPERP